MNPIDRESFIAYQWRWQMETDSAVNGILEENDLDLLPIVFKEDSIKQIQESIEAQWEAYKSMIENKTKEDEEAEKKKEIERKKRRDEERARELEYQELKRAEKDRYSEFKQIQKKEEEEREKLQEIGGRKMEEEEEQMEEENVDLPCAMKQENYSPVRKQFNRNDKKVKQWKPKKPVTEEKKVKLERSFKLRQASNRRYVQKKKVERMGILLEKAQQ